MTFGKAVSSGNVSYGESSHSQAESLLRFEFPNNLVYAGMVRFPARKNITFLFFHTRRRTFGFRTSSCDVKDGRNKRKTSFSALHIILLI